MGLLVPDRSDTPASIDDPFPIGATVHDPRHDGLDLVRQPLVAELHPFKQVLAFLIVSAAVCEYTVGRPVALVPLRAI